MTDAFRLLGPDDYKTMPWRNGGGSTTELALAQGPNGRFLWRISIATVDRSGPFSAFDGCSRIITLLSGDGMALSFAGEADSVRLDEPFRPFSFSGDWRTECRLLGGTVTDFNVIFDRARAEAKVTALGAIPGAQAYDVVGDTVFLYIPAGAAACRLPGHPDARLSARRLLHFRRQAGPGKLTLAADGPASALLVDISTGC